ncbi:hypothetical protein LTR28_009528, partial [Elasticomyces elasticus]
MIGWYGISLPGTLTLSLIIARTAVVFALQSWLAESPEQKRTASAPAYFSVGMA